MIRMAMMRAEEPTILIEMSMNGEYVYRGIPMHSELAPFAVRFRYGVVAQRSK